MVLFRLDDFDTNFHQNVGERDIKKYDVYSDIRDEKVGSIKDVLVDETGSIRYLVVDTNFWVNSKQVLLPIGRCRIDDTNRYVYAKGLTKEQVEYLPEFDDLKRVNYDYEERVRGVYRTSFIEAPLETMTPLETEVPLEAPIHSDLPLIGNQSRQERTIHKEIPAYAEPKERFIPEPVTRQPVYNRETYSYHEEPDLYQINEQEHNTLKLYEERLIANTHRVKTGEVTVGKHTETEIARVAVPVEKERVIVERTTPADAGRVVSRNEADFGNKEFVRMDIYEEVPDIQKQAVVREEVRVSKVVEQDTVEAQEKVRREKLDVNTNDGQIQERRG
jgi:uncharacterized protein (TIGR02271 family)